MITPATGIKPSKKIINAKPNNCGNPNIHSAITDKTQLTTAIKNCASITFPNERANFLPKYSISV